MFGKFITTLLLSVSLPACAVPHYVTQTGATTTPGQKADACQAKFASERCVSYTWEKMPTDRDVGSFLFKTFRPNAADGSPVLEDLDGTVAVMLWMPSMGHGSSPVTVERVDVGTYRATQVFFVMRGEWEIHFQVKDGNSVRDQAIVPINL